MNFLKKIIIVLTAISWLMLIAMFIGTIADGFVRALINFVIGLVLTVPLVALVLVMDEVEQLRVKVGELECENGRLERQFSLPGAEEKRTPPTAVRGRKAMLDWICAKCGSVNKANTTNCSECGSAY